MLRAIADAKLIGTALEFSSHRGRHGLSESPPAAERLIHRGRFKAAVHHAILALLVSTLPPVVLPGGVLHQILEALGVPLLQEVAGALPAKDVVSRVPPRRALVVALAHQEL